MKSSLKERLNNALDEMASAPFDFEGYKIFVTPSMAKKIEGVKVTYEAKNSILIQNILVNKEKRIITVVFRDGEHEIIKCSEKDEFDVNIGVALVIAQHLFGSKNKFHKEIKRKAKYLDTRKKETDKTE